VVPGDRREQPADDNADRVAYHGQEDRSPGPQRVAAQDLDRSQHDPEGVREIERTGDPDGKGQADRHPKAALQHGRRRFEVSADGSQDMDRGVADRGACARGGDGVAAHCECQVRDDAKRVVEIEPIENLLNRPAGPQLLGRPTVSSGAMLFARHLDGPKIRFGAARQHVRARAQGGDD
jgi:hypothetical protein